MEYQLLEKEFMTPDSPIKPIGLLAGRGSGKPSRRIIIITTSAARNRPDPIDELFEKLRETECVQYPIFEYKEVDEYVPNYWPKTPPILLKSIPIKKQLKKPYKQRLKRVKR